MPYAIDKYTTKNLATIFHLLLRIYSTTIYYSTLLCLLLAILQNDLIEQSLAAIHNCNIHTSKIIPPQQPPITITKPNMSIK